MASKAHAERLARAIDATGLAESVVITHAENRVNVLCRVQGANEKAWMEIVRNLLIVGQDEHDQVHAWQGHYCRHYFLKEIDGDRKMVWGWNISIHSLQMTASLDAVILILKGRPVRTEISSGELTEFPLMGASASRNVPRTPGGKGVHAVGEFHPGKK